ncbi:type III restriction enzyme [Micromonospora kangleipakensis]|uniref:Type III restriction enzyme n=1 Tax=Micromonospora kangleipakensis TaxID=1077942 RepID=A0A4Q8BJL2_9ACTN|nr:DEAD/DEAH box helicase family protein [Micromonospora kangleipakensis]RZU77623.1 type III restriction enzyme [Micromonospora kangleipakensis]
MADRVIENPILNSPFDRPSRHWKFDDDGITDTVMEGRRPSAYFVPVPASRRRGGQLSLPMEWTSDRLRPNDQVNQIRPKVDRWRDAGYPGVTNTTKALLAHWSSPERARRLFFGQREAVETAIWTTEVAAKTDPWVGNALADQNMTYSGGLPRVAHKMATGSGKTAVMAMLIAWHALNKAANSMDRRFSDRFLVVAPGITIRDRLRVLLPTDPDNSYEVLDLVPADLRSALEGARVAVVTFWAFGLRETGPAAGRLTKQILTAGEPETPFTESPDQMARRVCRELGLSSGRRGGGILVLNDEAHHCWQGPPVPQEEEKLTGEEKREAADRSREAHLWISGLKAIQAKYGIRQVYDLSATPFFLKGSGYGEGTLFPWVVSDFSLVDAIEAGIVKIPRLPVADNQADSDMPAFRSLWPRIREHLPRKGRKNADVGAEPALPDELQAALHSLYGNYEKSYRRWEDTSAGTGSTPPVFIVVCSNTTVSKMVYDWIAGWDKTFSDDTTVVQTGNLALFRNDDERGSWLDRPRTILVDSEQLESGEAMSADFKAVAQREIEEFKAEYRQRFPGRSAEALTEEDLLREVMNTVGKPGKLGEHVRCVVSVSMLTEGWDVNTVTHILGVRAFGTQLLCEQVVGRGLRRRSYALDPETGRFEAEYAEVYGVPFSFIPAAGTTKDPKPVRPVMHVRALPERAHLRIEYPRVVGYRYDLPDRRLDARFDNDTVLVLSNADAPTETEIAGVAGEIEIHTLDDLRKVRSQTVAYLLAEGALIRFRDPAGNAKPWLYPQLLRICRDWLDAQLVCKDDAFPAMVLLGQRKAEAVERIYRAVVRGTTGDGPSPHLLPMYRSFDPVGSTDVVEFDTTRACYETSPDRCHVSHVALHSGWEQKVAYEIEATKGVAACVKNDHLSFRIHYAYEGEQHDYEPDFLLRLAAPDGAPPQTVIVEVSGERRADKAAKTAAARNLWVPAVNNDGRYGTWSFLEITDPSNARTMLRETVEGLLGQTPNGKR